MRVETLRGHPAMPLDFRAGEAVIKLSIGEGGRAAGDRRDTRVKMPQARRGYRPDGGLAAGERQRGRFGVRAASCARNPIPAPLGS